MGLFKKSKNTNKPILRQMLDLIPAFILQQFINRYNGDKHCSRYCTYALQIPDVINISEAKVNDSQLFENKIFAANTVIVEDKGCFDFEVMKKRTGAKNIFVPLIKDNTVYELVTELELPDEKDHIFPKRQLYLN